jgi:3',5'-cyclic AMP phosphodiesterase CpdA
MKWTRRQLLHWSAGNLLAAGLWPGVLAAGDPKESSPFHFLVVNDTHYIDAGCGKWLARVVEQMKKHPEKPEFCLLVGDLSDHGRPRELTAMRDIIQTLGVPTYVVIGNHDYLAQNDRKTYEDLFPGRLNYRFDHRGWQFVALDTTEGQRAMGTKIDATTFRWLDDHLPKLDKKRPTVLFTHFPLGLLVPGRPKNAETLLARFKEYNLQAVFNGHFHAFTERKVNGTAITTNRCCSLRKVNHDNSKEKGYFLCAARAGKIERRFVEVPLI